MKNVSLLFFIMVLATAGLGCRRPVSQTPPRAAVNDFDLQAPAPSLDENTPPIKDTEGPSAEGLIARNALQNLALARSYRATMTIPTNTDNVKAFISVNREQGITGRMEIPNNGTTLISEIYITKDESLFRQGTSAWTDVKQTDEGKTLEELVQSTLAPEGKNITRIVSDNTRTVSVIEDASGCMLYTLSQVNSAGERLPYKICIKNDLPTYLTINSDKGAIRIDYTDINSSIEIIKP